MNIKITTKIKFDINPNKLLLFLVPAGSFCETLRYCHAITLYLWTKYVSFCSKRVKFISRSQIKTNKYKSNE